MSTVPLSDESADAAQLDFGFDLHTARPSFFGVCSRGGESEDHGGNHDT